MQMEVSAQCLCGAEDEISTASGVGWKIPYDLGADDEAWDIEPIDDASDPDVIPDNGLIVVGATHTLTTASDAFVMRLNMSGGVAWQIPFDKGLDDGAYAAHQTSTGEILVCGTTRTNKFTPGYNQNAWILKLNVADGSYSSGWIGGKEYGSTGRDVAYDIKEDLNGNYIIVGEATQSGNDVPSGVHSNGDYWVFKIEPDGDLIHSKVFYGSNEGTGNGRDYARSVEVDCNSGQYIVTGFCKSCDVVDGMHSELLMVKIYPATFQSTSVIYGYDGNVQHDWDYGSYNVIQPRATFGSCMSGDNFLSTGLQHPGPLGPPCFEKNEHDFWLVKTFANLINNTTFDGQCDNADVGNAYGGYEKDNGHSAVQTCNGYLITGVTKSSKNDEN